jgi:hypothetical protein
MLFALMHLGALLLLCAVFFTSGRVLLAALRLPEHPALGGVLSAFGLGLCAWPFLLFLLASVQLYRPWAVGALALGFVVADLGLALRRRALRSSEVEPARGPRTRRLARAWVLLPPAAIVLACAVLALSPRIGWDDDVYHLTLPKRYLEHGGFRPIPFSLFSHWPHGVELVYGMGLMLQDQMLAKLIHTAFLALLAWAVHRLCRARVSAPLALAAVLLVLCNQVVLFEASIAYIDIAFAFYLLLAVAYADRYLEDGRRSSLVAAGLYCGAVAGSKLTGFAALPCVGASVLTLAWFRFERAERLRRSLEIVLCLGLPTALLAVPWYAKSLLETGDPLYPMLYAQLGGIEWSAELGRRFFEWQTSIGMGRAPSDYLKLPLRIVLEGRLDGSLGPFWLVAGPLSLLAALWLRAARSYVLCALLYFAFWASASQQLRFLIAVLPLLAIGAAFAAHGLLQRLPWVRVRFAAGLLLAAAIAVSARPALQPVVEGAVRLAGDLYRRGPEPLERVVPDGHAFVNRHTPPDAKVMLLNVNRGFFLEREYIADSAFQASQMNWLLRHARSEAEAAALLSGLGITHLYVGRHDWGIRYPDWLQSFLQDGRYARLVYRCRGGRCSIYRLRTPS